MQDVTLHPDWNLCFNMGSRSLLDIYTAFAASDLSFRIPLVVNNKRQNISLATLLQQDLCELYMQTIAGLADFAPRAFSGPDTAEGRHFGLAACQSLAMIACMIETPGQIAKLADHHLMKHASKGQQAVSGVAMMARLDQTVRLSGFLILFPFFRQNLAKPSSEGQHSTLPSCSMFQA